MKIQIKVIKVLLLLFNCLALTVLAEQGNPHEIGAKNNERCLNCHIVQPETKEQLNTKNMPVVLSKFHLDGVAMCTRCHSDSAGHMVGVNIDFLIPADLPLSSNKSVSCLTCHYTQGSLISDRPQASYSFMDQLLDSDHLHKSYLIRRNNVNGELCLICHNTQQDTKQ